MSGTVSRAETQTSERLEHSEPQRAGGELVDSAIAQKADVFITADVRYHDFHHANGQIVLIDAGHFETEHPVVNAVVNKLNTELGKLRQKIPVLASQISTNPIYYS